MGKTINLIWLQWRIRPGPGASGNNIYSTGSFSLTTDFDPGAATYTLNTAGLQDIYIHKMSCVNPSEVQVSSSNTLLCSGNNATLTASGAATYTWNTAANSNIIVVSPTTSTTYTVNAADANGCASATSITQVISVCTGIASAELETKRLTIYPNPGKNSITLQANLIDNEESVITILNALGQVILQTGTTQRQTELSVAQLPVGIYFIQLSQNNKVYGPVKFIKE